MSQEWRSKEVPANGAGHDPNITTATTTSASLRHPTPSLFPFMTNSEDEYDEFYDSLDEEDLKRIDELCAQLVEPPTQTGSTRATKSTAKLEIRIEESAPSIKSPFTKRNGLLTPSEPTTPSRTSGRSKVGSIPVTDGVEGIKSSDTPSKLPIKSNVSMKNVRSLLRMFRPSGRLSVSDLVGPSWCEFKFEYSLIGKRWKGENMDDVVVSKHGKAIPVKKSIVIKADKIMSEGKAVHKKLEAELPVIEVVVKVTSKEERFALDILNMITGLQLMASINTCREFRVYGFVGDVYITGIIDEITRKPLPKTEGGSSPKRATPITSPSPRKRSKQNEVDDTQTKLDDFVVSPRRMTTRSVTKQQLAAQNGSPVKLSSGSSQGPLHRLHLNDTKTRESPTLPLDDLSGRLQLMMYHQLLEQMVKPPSNPPSRSPSKASGRSQVPLVNFSFHRLFLHNRLDSTAQFSDAFVAEALQILDGFDTKVSKGGSSPNAVRCLDDVVERWYETVRMLRLEQYSPPPSSRKPPANTKSCGPVDPHLELIYRTRDSTRPTKRKRGRAGAGKSRKKDGEVSAGRDAATRSPSVVPDINVLHLTEEEQLQRAIAESLKAAYLPPAPSGSSGVHEGTTSVTTLDAGLSSASDVQEVSGTSESGSTSARPPSPMDIDAMDDATLVIASQDSEVEWERRLGSGYIRDEDYLSIEIPALPRALPKALDKDVIATPGCDSPSTPGLTLPTKVTNKGKGKEIPGPLPAPVTPTKVSGRDTIKLPSPTPENDVQDETQVPSSSRATSKGSRRREEKKSSNIVGVKSFELDTEFLNTHIKAAIDFWEGRREPLGVELEDTWKCNTCEYREGCEWREAKAFESVWNATKS
ncbi:hypothetical protein FRB99_006345 [Tulasnella sp. 403]|nr:hypothetical protein FRB99_006345 [Tulasnella sp. 403]